MKQGKLKTTAIALLSLACLVNFSLAVSAETILEKIERTGEITAGARKDAIPFGYVDSQQKWTGYSVDLLELIRRRLQNKLQKPIKLNLQEVTIADRFAKVKEGNLDIACGATTITQERLELVDFSVPYLMTGAQFLVKLRDAEEFNYNGTLAKVSIAYIPGTTAQDILPQIYPFATWKPVKSREEGLQKLKKGEVKAVVSDGILLIGELVKQGNDPRQFALIPSQPITTELYGCILPQNEPEWKNFVDDTIVSEEDSQLQEQWFNVKKSKFPYTIHSFP
jgi:polar amino acid transport system substrate-binding protein